MLALLAALAFGQDGFDAHWFTAGALDGDLRDPVTLLRPGRMSAMEGYGSLVFDYANRPLVRSTADGRLPWLDHVVAAQLVGGFAPHELVRIDLDLPLYLTSQGPTGSQGFDLGDLRLGALVAFLQPGDEGGIGVGVAPWLSLPTGSSSDFLGQPGLGAGLTADFTVESGALTVGGQLGFQLNPSLSYDNLEGADHLLVGLSLGYLPR